MPYFVGTLDPVTNQEDWSYIFEIDDADTGDPVDLTGATITLNIRDPQYRGMVITNNSADGSGVLTVIDTGVLQINVPVAQMQGLRPIVYEVGLIVSMNGATRQMIVGRLPVQDGYGTNPL